MDRRFLSDQTIVARSRDFICVRLATYESAAEGKLLESVFTGRSGVLENSVFALLAPDGRTPLVRAGRSPDHSFRGSNAAGDMAVAMAKIASEHTGKAAEARRLPYLVDLRRALNVAACDIQPLAIVVASTKEARAKLESTLTPLAWSPEFVGRLAYVTVSDLNELAAIEGAERADGILVVQPDTFGLKGKLLSRDAGTDPAALSGALKDGLGKFVPETKDSQAHIREGVRRGVLWKTEIPATDPQGPKR